MGSRKVISTQQSSFLETLLLGSGTEISSVELNDALTPTPFESPYPSTVSPTPDEMADLFGFISSLVPSTPRTAPINTPHPARAATQERELEITSTKPEDSQSSFPPITPQWLLDHFPSHLTRIAAIWNEMRECAGLPSLESAEQILAPRLVTFLKGSCTAEDVEEALIDCCGDLESLTQRLYDDVSHQTNQEISRCVNVLMENALRQPYQDEDVWIRQALEVAARKVLAGQSKSIYSAFVVSTLQRPFRDIVRQSLQANELAFSERVLAQVREKGYAKTMRESLQTLARLGFTSQTVTTAWEAARSGQMDKAACPWIARRIDGCAAAIVEGYAIVEQRVIRSMGYALLALFDADRRITRQMTIATTALADAKQSLWSQGYCHADEGFTLPDRVVKLWSEFCNGRDNGWWCGDEHGRVMVVMPYMMSRRLGYHKPLSRAVKQMQAWDYRFRYDVNTLYLLPAGVEMAVDALEPKGETEIKGGE